MLEMFRLILAQKLSGAFLILILISCLTIILTIIASHMISSLLIQEAPNSGFAENSNSILVFLFIYIVSILSNLLTEYYAQTTTARVAGFVGRSYIDNIKQTVNFKNTDEGRLEYSSLLTTQLERFRAEYILPFTNIISRGFILFVTFAYLIYIYKSYALIGLGIATLAGYLYYYGISSILSRVDNGLTSILDFLGNVVGRITKSYIFLLFSSTKTPLAEQFSKYYQSYGHFRGLNAIVSLAPRFLIETCIVIAIFFKDELFTSSLVTENLVFLGFLFFRLNPHIQIFIKNIGTMKMAKTSFKESMMNSIQEFKKPQPKLKELSFPELSWNPNKERILQIKGPSGSGKTSLGLKIANHYSSLGYSIAFIESNPHLPFGSVSEICQLNEGFDKYLDKLGLDVDIDLDITYLSNGERQRLFIALALNKDHDLIILDEGLSALDQESINRAFKLLVEKSVPIVFISHQIDVGDFMINEDLKTISFS